MFIDRQRDREGGRARDKDREERHTRRLTFVGNVMPSPFTTISLVIPPGRDIVLGSACGGREDREGGGVREARSG